MAVYGVSHYGVDTYGLGPAQGAYPGSAQPIPVINTAYLIQNFVASPVDYQNVVLTWDAIDSNTITTVTEFRLITNPWGFPVDQTDGEILVDLTGSFHQITQYTDPSQTPGTLAYYGIYLLTSGGWVRAGFATCLVPVNHGMGARLFDLLPSYFQDFGQSAGNDTTGNVELAAPTVPASGTPLLNPYALNVTVTFGDNTTTVLIDGVTHGNTERVTLPAGSTITLGYTSGTPQWFWSTIPEPGPSTYIRSYLNVLGYGLDYLRTQYDFEFDSLNDPMKMSLGDLQNLALELGVPYTTEIPAYDMRKAVLFWARVMLERGTIGGIAEHITLLTGYDVDLQVSPNLMLDDDQSVPIDPGYPAWSSATPYVIGNIVTYPVPVMWNPASTYTTGNVVEYNGQLYTATTTSVGVPPGGAGWNQNVVGPYTYVCIANVTSAPGPAPSGTLSSNGTWTAIFGGDKNGSEYTESLQISGLLGNAGTWEFLEPGGTELDTHVGVGFPDPITWLQSGSTPLTIPNGVTHTIRALNNSGSTQAGALLRSLCRGTTGTVAPDPQLVVEHGVPVPKFNNEILTWSSTATYHTGDIVRYGNTDFIALRESTNATPPGLGIPLNPNYNFETSFTGTWTSDGVCTVTQVTSPVMVGTDAMHVAFTGTNASVHVTGAQVPVIPGATYEVTGFAFTTVASQNVKLVVNYYDPFGNFVSAVTPTATTLTTSTWNPLVVSFTVPAGVYSAAILPTSTGSGTWTANVTWDLVVLSLVSSPEWAGLTRDKRVPVMLSGYALDDLGSISPAPVTASFTPFIEWYDDWGNFITRVLGPSGTGYRWDSFQTAAGVPFIGRYTDDGSEIWSGPEGTWTVATNGSVYAGTTPAIGAIATAAAGYQAVTVTQPAPASHDVGVLFWYLDNNNYWYAGLNALYYRASGTTTIVNYTGTPAVTGDRIYVWTNNTTSTATLVNGSALTGPFIVVWKNSYTTANILVAVTSGTVHTGEVAMPTSPAPYLPSTGATSSFGGIIMEVT